MCRVLIGVLLILTRNAGNSSCREISTDCVSKKRTKKCPSVCPEIFFFFFDGQTDGRKNVCLSAYDTSLIVSPALCLVFLSSMFSLTPVTWRYVWSWLVIKHVMLNLPPGLYVPIVDLYLQLLDPPMLLKINLINYGCHCLTDIWLVPR